MEIINTPGFYGKVHVLGDFVSRRLPTSFIEPWDAWLQGALIGSKDHLGPNWLDTYLTSPIWRFILSPGICGSTPWAGILMPSVDKVGRYFPLTMAAQIKEQYALPRTFVIAADWFERLEQLALSALEDDFNLADFDQKLQEPTFQLTLPENDIYDSVKRRIEKDNAFAFQVILDNPSQMTGAFIQLGDLLLRKFLNVYSLWNTCGFENVKSVFMVYEKLPLHKDYSELLGVQKQTAESNIETATVGAEDTQNCLEPDDARLKKGTLKGPHFQWQSSGRSTVGKQRKINEDAFLECPEIGLWVVADGMGGHSAGDIASKAVIDALNSLSGSGNLDTLIAGAAECLKKVNEDLTAKAKTFGPEKIIGTTVVVMLAAGKRCACMWVGDSRLYRYRDGNLSQLTRDHTLAAELSQQEEPEAETFKNSRYENIVTRALGGHPELLLDSITFEATEGDIYLLCSDGLIKELNSREIATILDHKDDHESSQQLIDLALERGARDNVTVIVVHAEKTC